ncbi:MAG TPA: leucine zipper domain-containing protein [Candidatus Thermoplasmatota archaeon]|nr:leucine zipper domain-containing protein [Candidatus Thermoplasmatota archaeon]
MYIYDGKLYLTKDHVHLLKKEPEYVKQRYPAVSNASFSKSNIIRDKMAHDLGLNIHHFNRLLKKYRDEGLSGLRNSSTRTHQSPNHTEPWLEELVIKVREKTGFGSAHLSLIVNISLENQGRHEWVHPRTISRILVRRGIIESEKRAKTEWKRFEWGHPNRLVQSDLTLFNGIPLLTMEDDYSRRGWAIRLKDQRDATVINGMKTLLKIKYDNLLTDNGSQFSRRNKVIREYCEHYINEKHIWTSIHHPQTMGKLSAFQKGLKRFLRHKLGTSQDIHEIDLYIDIYVPWYNNGKYHSTISSYPEERYSGQRDIEWYNSLVKSLKLEDVLVIKSEG